MKNAAETGRWGEQIVVDRLRADGCLIMERNWRYGRYEIDIIALKNECIRFVEVKTRSASGWSSGEDAIDAVKERALMRAASAYLARTRSNRPFRFDLAVVEYRTDGSYEVRYTESIAESHW